MSGALLLLWALASLPATPVSKDATQGAAVASGTLNVNNATPDALDALPGIGRTLAERIVEARSHRSFHAVHDLLRVKGFGQKRLRTLKPYLSVSGASTFQLKKDKPALKEGGDIPSASPAKDSNTEPTPDGPRALDREDDPPPPQPRSSSRRGPMRRHRVSSARTSGDAFTPEPLRQGAAPSLAARKNAPRVRLRRHAGPHLASHH